MAVRSPLPSSAFSQPTYGLLSHPPHRRQSEGQALARRLGVSFVETSAKTCVNVEKAYYTVVRQIREQRGEVVGKGGKPPGQKKKSKCLIL